MNAFLKITAIASTFAIGATSCLADIVSDRLSAVTVAEQAFRQQPDNSEIQFKLGRAYLMAGRYISAWQCLNKLVAREPSNDKARLYMGLAAIGTNNKNAAQRILAPISKVSPVDLGLALALAGQPTEAISKMEPLLSSPSASARLRQNLAFAYAAAERWNDASKMAGQDLSPDQVNTRLAQWSRVIREKNGALQLQAFIGVPPAKDYGFLSSVTPANANAVLPSQKLVAATPTAAPFAATANALPQPAPAPTIAAAPVIQPKPSENTQSATTPNSNPSSPPMASGTATPTPSIPAAPPTLSNPNTPSTIAEIDLPSSTPPAATEKTASAPVKESTLSSNDAPAVPLAVSTKEKIPPQAPAAKKSLNLPIKEIIAENAKNSAATKIATPPISPAKTEKKDPPAKAAAPAKETAESKKEEKHLGQDCPIGGSATTHCHLITYPAIQLATHKLPVSLAATEQNTKILKNIQAKWPAAAKYKLITYSETGSPVYRLLLTGFTTTKEAQESCNALMKKDVTCIPSSYKEASQGVKSSKIK